MKRREYIKSMVLASAAAYMAPQFLMSCSNDAKNFPVAGKLSQQPMATFEEIRNAARLSKGHLYHEMQRVMASKNAKAIYNFVNRNFKLIPSSATSVYYDYETIRWGQQGLLRYGKGTLREKNDLLFAMLKEAGFNPSLHYTTIEVNPEIMQGAFMTKKESHNAIEAPSSFIKKWNKTFEEHQIFEAIDEHFISSEKAKTLANNIAQQLPSNAQDALREHDFLTSKSMYIPVVKFLENDKERFINVFENLSFEENCKKPSGTLNPEKVNKRIGKITATIKANYAGEAPKVVDLVTGTWDFQNIVGKQIAIQFASTIPTMQLLQTKIEAVNQFVPFLTLVDPTMPNKERKKLSFQGVGFDTFGNTFQKNEDGTLCVNNFKLNTHTTAKPSEVATVKALLIDDYYPSISLRISPLDVNNQLVLGLPNSAFTITDQGQTMPAIVTQNSLHKNVLILIDNSGSMPYTYQSNQLPENLKKEIEKAFTNTFEQVAIHFKSFNQNTNFLEVLSTESTNSYDAILCFGDGGEIEDLTAKALKAAAKETFVSYHFLKTAFGAENHSKAQECFKEASLFFGFVDDFSLDIKTITKTLKTSQTHYPYVVTYQSPSSKDAQHKVTLQLNDNHNIPKNKLSYVAEDAKSYLQSAVPIGLQLELEWKQGYSTQKITRNLVGYNANKLPNKEHISSFAKAVKDFVLGSHYIAFEGDTPTLPALIDQSYSQLLTQAKLADNNSTFKEKVSTLENEQSVSSHLLTCYTGVPDDIGDNRLSYQDGFQAILYTSYHDTYTQESILNIDMLPTSNLITVAKTKQEAFIKTLENSAYLALSEAQHFESSTFSFLKEKPLKLFSNADKNHPNFETLRWQKSSNHHLLYDASLQNLSYWQIKKDTGELLGILPNGSGGGKTIKQQRMDMALRVWEAYTNQLIKVTRGGMAMGVVALYGMFLAELYALVALVVNDMGANTDFEEDLEKLLKKYAKKGYKKIKKGLKKK